MKQLSKTTVALMVFLLVPLVTGAEFYSTNFDGSEPSWYCYTTGLSLDTCTTDATDSHTSPPEALKASRSDGVCGRGGAARHFSVSGRPGEVQLDLRAKADNYGFTHILLNDSSGTHTLWEKDAGGSSYDTGWVHKELDISGYDSDFTLTFGNADDTSYCDNSDHGWALWVDNLTVKGGKPPSYDIVEPSTGKIVRDFDTNLTAFYDDPDGDEGSITFYNSSGMEIDSCSGLLPGDYCNVSWTSYDHGENDWYLVAEDNTSLKNQSAVRTLIHNNPPTVNSFSPGSASPPYPIIYDTRVDLNPEFDDPDGDTLEVSIYNNKTGDRLNTASGLSPGTYTYTWKNLNRGREKSWHYVVEDQWEKTRSWNQSFTVNSLPTVNDYTPENGAETDSTGTTLEVTASDAETSVEAVYFFNASDNTLIGADTTPGDGLDTDWDGLERAERYYWYVNVSDSRSGGSGENFTNKGSPRTFFNGVGEKPRVKTGLNFDYTSILTQVDSPETIELGVENRDSVTKNLEITASGVNAKVAGRDKYTVNIGPGEYERVPVTVRPTRSGQQTLTVKVNDTELKTVNREEIPVYASEKRAGTRREVPGISFIQVAVLAASTLLIYYSSL